METATKPHPSAEDTAPKGRGFELIHGFHLKNLRGDIYGGLTAAVVALPLALAFGVASGAGAIAGLYGAIFVGLFAAVFGGTPAQISGPTGPMTVVMAGVIVQFAGEPAKAFTVVMLAGLFQIGFGILRLGRYIALVPYPVISGFMSGIGCIIIILQLGPLVGHAAPGGGVVAALLAVPGQLASPGLHAAVIGLLALAIVFFTPRAVAKIVPSPLLALVAGTLLVVYLLPGAPVIGDIPTGLPSPILPSIDTASLRHVITAAFALALLGSIDSLLTSLVADNITRTHHRSNRELIGQGIGNFLAGLFGAIPGAGATMRTVINVRTGGRTPISGTIHALVLLALVLGLGGLAEKIPNAVLAGILIKVGLDIIDWDYLKRAPKAPRAGVAFMLIVLGLTVFVDLIAAVAVGMVLASLLLVKRIADLQLASMKEITGESTETPLSEEERSILRQHQNRILLVHLSGPMSFGAASDMAHRLGAAGQYDALVLDMSDVTMMDSTSALALESVIVQTQSLHKSIYLCGLTGKAAAVLERLGVSAKLSAGHMLGERLSALQQAANRLSPPEGHET
jgi:SulP family sulfate permease